MTSGFIHGHPPRDPLPLARTSVSERGTGMRIMTAIPVVIETVPRAVNARRSGNIIGTASVTDQRSVMVRMEVLRAGEVVLLEAAAVADIVAATQAPMPAAIGR